ncbi:hypothetical protein [uncultured Friedmanniella sp.]|uniref:hypothetical protein n=1 Tax=uncultured Friedmanniella sp. TaxID=335381 RepID=UPI0035CBFB63
MADRDDGPATVDRLLTTVDLDEEHSHERQLSVSARLEAVLADGRRVLLLNDRGWSASGPPDLWARMSVEEIAATARDVVGPDEPAPGRTQEEERSAHWDRLAGELHRNGVAVSGDELERLPHDIVLGEPLRRRLPA